LAVLAGPAFAAPKATDGVLLLAHGGDPAWNAEVESLRVRVDSAAPAELALGMADPAALQAAVDRLEGRGVSRIVAVPLFVHSRSEVMDQTRYALGLADKPSEVMREAAERMKHMKMPPGMPMHRMPSFSLERVRLKVPIFMAAAIDSDPFVSRVLLDRAKALSRDPGRETVVLVAHGPVDDADVPAWMESLAAHAEAVRAGGPFGAAVFGVLRDDAPPPVRARAVAALRALVSAASARGGRALVVPVLIARGGLAGLDFAWSGEALMPHDGFDAWVLSRASSAAAPPH
jgi:sirohydrochlorin ferrochelatase